jgi:hypothetical protein
MPRRFQTAKENREIYFIKGGISGRGSQLNGGMDTIHFNADE